MTNDTPSRSRDASAFDAFMRSLARAPAAAIPAELLPEPMAAAAVVAGRYRVQRRLGGGGMGDVYLATDTRLGRVVALKVAREPDHAREREIAMREAKVMATVAHENVVQVFEVGTHQGRLFIAMEHVPGGNAYEWASERLRSWQEVLAVGRDAGRGLAAAHAWGIVHRDFKPANLLVGADGRARVADFGLATYRRTPTTDDDDDDGRSRRTRPGIRRWVGTLGYVAPEQYLGADASPATDQFALCVTVWELLFGRCPFIGATADEVCAATLANRIAPVDERRAPDWVREVLQRGLGPQPEDRQPDVLALVAALDPMRRRERRMRAGALAVALGCIAFAGFATAGMRSHSCDGFDAEMARVWNPERADAITSAFARTESSSAARNAVRIVARLDGWTDEWTAARRDVCEAANAGASGEAVDRSTGCLQGALARFRGTVELLSEPDRDVVAHADAVLAGLATPTHCVDVTESVPIGPSPPSPFVADRVDAIRTELARADAQLAIGALGDGNRTAAAALAEARDAGYGPVVGEALLIAGIARKAVEDRSDAVAKLEEAHATAVSHDDDRTAARAAIEILPLVALGEDGRGRAEFWHGAATAAERRVGQDERPSWQLEAAWAGALYNSQQHDAAAVAYERAIESQARTGADPMQRVDLLRKLAAIETFQRPELSCVMLRAALANAEQHAQGDHPVLADVLVDLGVCLGQSRQHAAALPEIERGLRMRRALFGNTSIPVLWGLMRKSSALRSIDAGAAVAAARDVLDIARALPPPNREHEARALITLGQALESANELDEALRHLREAAIALDVLGRPMDAAVAYDSTCPILWRLGRMNDAVDAETQALEALDRAGELQTIRRAAILVNRASTRADLADFGGAYADIDRATEIIERSVGRTHAAYGHLVLLRADIYKEAGRLHESVAEYRRALAVYAAAGADPAATIGVHANLGRALLRVGDPAGALDAAERGLAVLAESGGGRPATHARLTFTLGTARWRLGERREGVRLVTEAERELVATGEDTDSVEQMRAWLRAPS